MAACAAATEASPAASLASITARQKPWSVSNGVAASRSTSASMAASSSAMLFGLHVEILVDVAERALHPLHQLDAAADQAERHAGLQQDEAGADALDVGVARIGQHEVRRRSSRRASATENVRVPSSATNFVLSARVTPSAAHDTTAMTLRLGSSSTSNTRAEIMVAAEIGDERQLPAHHVVAGDALGP